jgi:cation transport ATPase
VGSNPTGPTKDVDELTVGIGMGAGTNVAFEEADIVLMTNDLGEVPAIIRLSQKAYGTIMQNFYGTLMVDGIGSTLAFQDSSTLCSPLNPRHVRTGSSNSTRLV